MADTKYPTIRYQTLDKCFRNKFKKYFIEDLIDACSEAIFNYCGKEIGCSRRTILNDIKFMESEAGWLIPLERHRFGKEVYYRYEDTNFSINQSFLSDDESEKLSEAISMLERFKGLPGFEWMDDLLFKLQSGMHKASPDIFDFQHAPSLKGMHHIKRLFNSILYKQTIVVQYCTFNGIKHNWVIHPYLIKQYNNRWFLFGKNTSKDGAITNIPIDRIEEIGDADIPYEENDGQLQEMLKNVIGVTINWKGQKEDIKLKFSPERFPYVLTKKLHESQVVLSEEERIVQIQVVPNKELEAQILYFGSDVEVIGPPEFKAQIREKIQEMMKKY